MFSWDLSNIADDANLSAVVFVQNNKTREIYQSLRITKDHAIVSGKASSGVLAVGNWKEGTDFTMYPNPSDQEVFVKFDQVVQEDLNWTLYDQSGRVYHQGRVNAGAEGFNLDTNSFPSGMYYLSVQGEKIKFDFKKLMIVH